jgi:hypothetical protein
VADLSALLHNEQWYGLSSLDDDRLTTTAPAFPAPFVAAFFGFLPRLPFVGGAAAAAGLPTAAPAGDPWLLLFDDCC